MKTKLSRVLIAVISVVMMLTAVPAVDYYVSTPTAVTASAASKKKHSANQKQQLLQVTAIP